MRANIPSTKMDVRVLIALLVGLLLNIGLAFLDLGRFHAVLALTIAVVQAMLVILFFMHVRYGDRLIWLYVGAGFFWLAIMVSLAMSDYLSRGYWPSHPLRAHLTLTPVIGCPQPMGCRPELAGDSQRYNQRLIFDGGSFEMHRIRCSREPVV